MSEKAGKIIKVAGPLVVASGMKGAKMYEVVQVSDQKLIGEIIELKDDTASIQVYEETSGLGPGEPVYQTGKPLSVELGPGLLKSIYDGIQRPLNLIREQAGDYITRGVEVPSLDREKTWKFTPVVKDGDEVSEGDILGEVPESATIVHKVMVPPGVTGKVENIKAGDFNIVEPIAKVGGKNVAMLQVWPIRKPRPVKQKLVPTEPLITGQRSIDTFFPVVKGGAACIPGPFGSGKTVTQHQLAKWADADIIIFIGCGERGNEMTEVLIEFPELIDPKSGKALMERTVLIANTSNMPVAAREASIYTGMTLAEYYRDMGYNVALMADSTSRWAEALREMSGRLEEMPGEEGYPAYLGSRTASFYERAGYIKCLGSDDSKERIGSLTAIGAVSPPGGDLSEPVTQNTLRVVKVFWGLDAALAYRRHFPAINWLTSYSLYIKDIEDYTKKNYGSDWPDMVRESLNLLQEEAKLEEIVRLVGVESLSAKEQLVLDTTKTLREDYLFQDSFDDADTYASPKKMYAILKTILTYHHESLAALEAGNKNIKDITGSPLKDRISRTRMIEEKNISEIDKLTEDIKSEINK
ncbi:MAG: V-type ATP synthase subunit A [Parcubacteria group bacterium]|nr:V-type ATP synthase subunit A [Parcubacteria group bacterium]